MKIPLTQGKFAIVGPRDYKHLMQWKWYYKDGYAIRHDNGRPGRPPIRMHHVVLERMGFKSFEDCDHINRSGIDNRRRNLRVATRRQNLCNRNKFKNNTSGYRGVYRYREKWRVLIRVDGKLKHFGSFEDKKEAAHL